MKKLLALILILTLLLPAAVATADLSDFEKEYVGVWTMYATHGSAVYNYSLTFMEDRYVFLHTMRIIEGNVYNDATSKGLWRESYGKITFTIAGVKMVCQIGEDGFLYTMNMDTLKGAGTYFRCPDMGYTIE